MSVSNSMVCDKCKIDLVIGQGGIIVYSDPSTEEQLRTFLEGHKGHPLRYTDENDSSIENYNLVGAS